MTWSTGVFALWVSLSIRCLPEDSKCTIQTCGGKGTTIRPNMAKKRKEKEHKKCIHALWLHPAAPFGIHFGFLSVVMVTSGTGGATTKCLHWMTAAEARAAWNGVFSKGDRVVPERPARTRAHKRALQQVGNVTRPANGGCPWSQCYFYARLL